MSTIAEYLDLITSEHRQKPKFSAMVSSDVSVQVQVQDLLTSMIPIFDVDTAVGDQLDVLGEWIGISRDIAVPIPGVFFSWDGTDASLGWEFGIWQDPRNPTEITVLPDDVYRRFIKAKIAANAWDGTTDGAYAIWDTVFTDFTIIINDKGDMSYDMGFVGGSVDSLTLALIAGGYLPLKPEGVKVNVYYIPVDDNRLFGWDVDTTYLAGWDDGSWAKEITPT